MLQQIWLYGIAVFGHWQSYATGGGAMALLLVWEKLVNPISKRMFRWIVLGAFLAVASFMAWDDAHNELVAIQERLKSPAFSMEFQGTWEAKFSDGTPYVLETATLSNRQGAASGVTKWAMAIAMPNGSVRGEAPAVPYEGIAVPLNVKGTALHVPSNYYFPRTTTHPIQPGEAVDGWFWSVFPGITRADLDTEPELTVSFVDVVTEKPHESVNGFLHLSILPLGWRGRPISSIGRFTKSRKRAKLSD
jgi:hypothetical protein